jgi:DNA-binding transcriptional LysR family regulator
MLAAVVSGCGIMQIQTWLAAGEIKKGTLMPLLPEFAGSEMPIHAIWSATRYMKPKTRAIIDCLIPFLIRKRI